MFSDMNDGQILVPLREKTIATLAKLRKSPNESLDDIIGRTAKLEPENSNGASSAPPSPHPSQEPDFAAKPKCSVEVLGQLVGADSLSQMFAEVVDLVHGLAPEVLEKLATMKAQKRRYIARSRHDVHPGRSDLLVIGTRSGWYVSRNVGKRDVERALRALCEAANLVFGIDIRFAG